MIFSDIHIHALFGVDDGAATEEQMYSIVDAAYADGTRTLCMTPHFHIGYYGDNTAQTDAAFGSLKEYVRERYPDLDLYLGNELRYSGDCDSWLKSGACRTLNGTRYVLVDFNDAAEADYISKGLRRLLNSGYTPVLAHAERYDRLVGRGELLHRFRSDGIVIQLDSQSVLREWGLRYYRRSMALLSKGLADIICSDAHDTTSRPPLLSRCAALIERKFDGDYAEELLRGNALKLLEGKTFRKEL